MDIISLTKDNSAGYDFGRFSTSSLKVEGGPRQYGLRPVMSFELVCYNIITATAVVSAPYLHVLFYLLPYIILNDLLVVLRNLEIKDFTIRIEIIQYKQKKVPFN